MHELFDAYFVIVKQIKSKKARKQENIETIPDKNGNRNPFPENCSR